MTSTCWIVLAAICVILGVPSLIIGISKSDVTFNYVAGICMVLTVLFWSLSEGNKAR